MNDSPQNNLPTLRFRSERIWVEDIRGYITEVISPSRMAVKFYEPFEGETIVVWDETSDAWLEE